MTEAESDYTGFFRAEFQQVVRSVYFIAASRQAAEDAAQDAFSQLYVHWGKVSKYDSPGAWVRRVAIRSAARSARRDAMRHVLSRRMDVVEQHTGPRDLDILDALRALPRQQRAAVTLFYFDDRPVVEIALILECSPSTVKGHLFKARRHLADTLGDTEEGDAHVS